MVREKLGGVIRALLYVMVLFVEFLAVNRYRQIQENTTEWQRRARRCSWAAHLVLRRQSSSACAYGRILYTRRWEWVSEWVSERASRVVRVSTRGWLFIGQSAQLRTIKNATVAHGRCLICMHDACKWTLPNHRVLACRCMQMDGACSSCMHAWDIYSCRCTAMFSCM